MRTKERGEDRSKPPRVPPVLTMPDEAGAATADGPHAGAPAPQLVERRPADPDRPGESPEPQPVPAAPERSGAGPASRVLLPGVVLPGGRYRLIERMGGADAVQFWRGLDTLMGREVALTRLPLPQDDPVVAHRIGARTARASAADNGRSIARVFDVVETAVDVVVVAEWIEGWSVLEVAETGPGAGGAARSLVGLARAGADAHAAGAVLGLDDPGRLRIDARGRVVLAFPGVLPEADRAGDIRGIGAALYALTARVWPDGADPIPPRRLYPEVPMRLSALAVDALEERIAGIDTVVAVFESYGTPDGDIELDDVEDPAAPEGATVTVDAPAALDDSAGQNETGDAAESDRLGAKDSPDSPDALAVPAASETRPAWRAALIAGIAVVLTVATIAWLDWSPPTPDNPPARVLAAQPAAHAPAQARPVVPAPAPPPPPPPVVPVAAAVYSPQKFPDDAADAGLAIDQNPATSWSTDPYYQQLPAFKNGVGLVLTLPETFDPHSVTITSPTPGTHVEIRTAPGPSGDLAQTQVLGAATLGPGATTVPLAPGAPVNSLLVWIDGLGHVGDFFQSTIQDITVGR